MADDKYKHILLKKTSDNEIEYFWYQFKEYVQRLKREYGNPYNNIYNNTAINYCIEKIEILSDTLNCLQNTKQYSTITLKIRDFILYVAIMLVDINILKEIRLIVTQIKRWNNIKNNINKIDFNELNKNGRKNPANDAKIQTLVIIKIISNLLKPQNIEMLNCLQCHLDDLSSNYKNNNQVLIKITKLCIIKRKYGLIEHLSKTVNTLNILMCIVNNQDVLEEIHNELINKNKNKISFKKLMDKYYDKIIWKEI